MSKHRGKMIKDKNGARPRGKCPSCGRTGVKLIYENTDKEKVCKNCRPKERRLRRG